MTTEIRKFRSNDVLPVAEAFRSIGWNKPVSQYEKYLEEQSSGCRIVLIAFENNEFAGSLTIIWESNYPPFKVDDIPEVQDFNVLPKVRRKGIGTQLMDEAEMIILTRSNIAGIGVGLTSDYGPAQRLYISRGYEPDGKGIVWQNKFPNYGEQVKVDDDLILYFTKQL